eukprot:m51a1_g6952 hypothetical protein (147) ;mRNA; f:30184-30948
MAAKNVQAAIDVTDPAIAEAYAEIRQENSSINWFSIGYNGTKAVKLDAKGNGGVDELRGQLPEHEPQYGYLRVSYKQPGDELKERTKFVFYSWGPASVKPLLKAKMSVHQAAVKDVIKDFSISIQASELDELTEDLIQQRLAKSNY